MSSFVMAGPSNESMGQEGMQGRQTWILWNFRHGSFHPSLPSFHKSFVCTKEHLLFTFEMTYVPFISTLVQGKKFELAWINLNLGRLWSYWGNYTHLHPLLEITLPPTNTWTQQGLSSKYGDRQGFFIATVWAAILDFWAISWPIRFWKILNT